jgi:oxygen-independent coproporphyrinogen III oxidase
MAGIYLHIPFCKQACHYCDFHFSTNLSLKKDLIRAMGQELVLQKDYFRETVNTIYLGGGTPSIASSSELNFLFEIIRNEFTVSHDAEITLEANPDDLTESKLNELKNIGINRLSIGIQSFDDAVLKFLNRAHDSADATSCISAARRTGFSNISIDLIYAIPNQDLKQWRQNILRAIALSPEHISAYSLTIEEKTVFGNWSARGKIQPVTDDIAAEQLEVLLALLEEAGYDHYEISNFARPGYHSRHNSGYWQQEKYLGIGPSAHSYNGLVRQHNVSNNYAYVSAVSGDKIPATVEYLSRQDLINDYLLTTLRTSWGTDLSRLREEMDYDVAQLHGQYIRSLIENHLAIMTGPNLVLTRKGKFLADKISSDLFVTTA